MAPSDGTVYSSLCNAFERELVIDIMSGASAGGVNGGLLAAAMRFERRLDPKYIRDQWLELGDFSEAPPYVRRQVAAPSLLPGKLFVDSLLEVFGDLAADEAHARSLGLAIPDSQSKQARSSTPNLDVTVTDVRGTERTYRDKWQEIFAAREYRRRFSFRHKADFTPENLAEAARCSASFPAAFEPYRPNAGSWSLTNRPIESLGEGPPWTIDGGLLDNAPIRAAIDLIPTRPARRQVKRFLVYVNPESQGQLEPRGAGVGTNADGRTLSDEPDLAKVAGYVVNLPRKLPFVDQLDAIGDAVQKSSRVADGVLDLLAAPIETLDDAAKTLFPAYASRRRLKSLRELLRDPAAAERAYDDLKATGVELPWIPKTLDVGGSAPLGLGAERGDPALSLPARPDPARDRATPRPAGGSFSVPVSGSTSR